VKYPEQFVGNNRIVELTGEGCFKVTHNPEKPFIVKMENMSITVLGTIFNVKSHPYDQTDLVEVKEGKVQVDLPEAMMRISSGEHVIINKISDSYSKEKDIMEKFAIWRTGGIRFNSTPIQDVAKELERIYHCKVIFSGNKPYDNLITGIHERATLKDVLNSIEYVTGIRYKYQNNTVILYNN
jgi:ferric-dicitrate binding protein FerR (iron transport regulator)